MIRDFITAKDRLELALRWYWAYTSPSVDGTTYIFSSYDKAIEHALFHGEFDEICGKDAFMAHEEVLFFEVREDEIEEYLPFEKVA